MTPIRTYRYSMPNIRGEGWAIVLVDSTGVFTVVSDWGNYGYRWPENGWGPRDFRAFLAGCDGDYVRRKIAPRKVYDGDDTRRSVKQAILEARRDRTWKRDRARNEWNAIRDYGDFDTSEDFARWLEHTSLDEAYEYACYGPEPEAVAFIEHLWPRIQAALLADIESETKAVAS